MNNWIVSILLIGSTASSQIETESRTNQGASLVVVHESLRFTAEELELDSTISDFLGTEGSNADLSDQSSRLERIRRLLNSEKVNGLANF